MCTTPFDAEISGDSTVAVSLPKSMTTPEERSILKVFPSRKVVTTIPSLRSLEKILPETTW